MADHGARDHATWSASASDRRWGCPGSLVMEAEGPPDKESEAAAWGTVCHQLAEMCLRSGDDAIAHLGTTQTTKDHSFVVDEEMVETTQVYLDYVRKAAEGGVLLIEQKFSLDSLGTPFPAGGTGDAVILRDGSIEVVDLKGGRGVVVEAEGNKQLRTYALGAVLANPGSYRTVKVTIVQPRAPHPDGRIRSEEFHVADLIDWTGDLLEAMAESARAESWYSVKPMREWAADFLRPGTHCTFCKARATCPALASRAMEEAHTFFQPETGKLSTPPAPESLGVEQIVRILDHADMISNWLNAVRAYAQDLAEMGVDVTDGDSTYVLTPKRATRKWNTEDQQQLLAVLQLCTDRDAAEFYDEPKLLTPAKVEKLLGKKGYEAVKHLVSQESSGLNLTRSDKTTRGAVVAPAKQFFQIEGGQ